MLDVTWTAVLIVLAGAAWGVCVLSYFVECSTFTATPARPKPGGTQVQRDEVHYMFGRGRAMILSMNVFTTDFNSPVADPNSKSLAWAVLPNSFPSPLTVRANWTPAGPVAGGPLWMPAAFLTLGAAGRIVLVRRRVPPGRCRRCRYDLTATPPIDDTAIMCPECGLVQEITAQAPRTPAAVS